MPLVMFLDESGDHSLSKIDPQYPAFVLCGVILDPEYHEKVLTPALNDLKMELFGTTDMILHKLDFTRNRAGFEVMSEPLFRRRFFSELQSFIKTMEF